MARPKATHTNFLPTKDGGKMSYGYGADKTKPRTTIRVAKVMPRKGK